mmetsp:Transcript_26718/g.59943  ORF Transcript_26718/g.59943 Transcript_26718/m.59943 type:complete len:152 (+) Transcript_26718:48-503(+)
MALWDINCFSTTAQRDSPALKWWFLRARESSGWYGRNGQRPAFRLAFFIPAAASGIGINWADYDLQSNLGSNNAVPLGGAGDQLTTRWLVLLQWSLINTEDSHEDTKEGQRDKNGGPKSKSRCREMVPDGPAIAAAMEMQRGRDRVFDLVD